MSLRDSPLAALAELRLRLALRRLRARGGVSELVARIISYLVLLPMGFVFAAFVAVGMHRAARIGQGMQVDVPVSAVLFGVWQAWTAVALSLQEAEALDLRRFLVYPLRPGRVYALGLSAAVLADPFSLFWCLLLVGAWVGAAAGRFGGWLLPLAVTLALFAFATAAFVALLQEVAARLLRGRRLRGLLIALVYVGLALGAVALSGIRRVDPALLRAVGWWLQWLAWPAALAAAAARALFVHDLRAAWPWMIALAASGAASGGLAFRLALAEARSGRDGAPATNATGRSAGWALERLPGQLGPLLEREVRQLLRHPLPGVLLLVVPALAGVVAWKASPHLLAEASEVLRALPLLAFALYAHLTTQVFWLNAFGWDRGGARLAFLAPIDLEEVLLAKNGAAYALSALLYLGCVVVTVALVGWPPAWALLAAPVLHLGVTPWLYGLGNLASVLNPRAGALTLQRSGNLPALSALAGMAIVSVVAGLFALPVLLALWLDQGWLLPLAWAGLGTVGAAAWRLSLPAMARLLWRRREPLLAAVTGDDL